MPAVISGVRRRRRRREERGSARRSHSANVTIHAARVEDARVIADVPVRTWQAAYRHAFPAEVLDALSVDEREAGWRERLDAGMRVWVAAESAAIVGFAAAGPSRTEE